MVKHGVVSPDRDVLRGFGVDVVSVLGLQYNMHWLVDHRGKPLVLRRFGTESMPDVEYHRVGDFALSWRV